MSWLDQAIGGFQGIVLEAAVFIRGLRVVRVYLGLFGTLWSSSEISSGFRCLWACLGCLVYFERVEFPGGKLAFSHTGVLFKRL